VAQGQLLAVLEIPELQQQLQLDESAVHRSEQDLARSNEELSRSQSAFNVTHLTYTRLADVQKRRPELFAQEEIDEAQGKDLEANAGISSAKDAVAGAEQALIGSKASLEKDKAMFAHARISAPFNGVVTRWTPIPARSFPPELPRLKAIRRSAVSRKTISLTCSPKFSPAKT
jgi:multidrug resistance efflux pump